MNFKLPDVIIRQKQARRAHEEIREAIAQTDTDQALSGVSNEADAILQANQKIIQESGLSSLVEQLERAIQDAPVFSITLATYPHDTFLAELSGWFRREIHMNSLFKIHVRRSIGGGIVVQSKNRMFDLSFRPRILEAKDKLPEVVRNV